LEPNVRFWIDAYAKYPTTNGIIHDAADLNIVYGIIDLLPPDKPGSRYINQERIQVAKEQYRKILEDLAENGDSEDPEKRRIADLFGTKAGPDDFREAINNIRCQLGQMDRFEKGLIRSGAYLQRIKAIFRSMVCLRTCATCLMWNRPSTSPLTAKQALQGCGSHACNREEIPDREQVRG